VMLVSLLVINIHPHLDMGMNMGMNQMEIINPNLLVVKDVQPVTIQMYMEIVTVKSPEK
jgi:hypothetical protein